MNPINSEKIKKLKEIFGEFHSKMLVLRKRQTVLLGKVSNLLDEKKLKVVRERIKEIYGKN